MNRHGDDLIVYLFNRSTRSRAYVESGLIPERTGPLPPEPVQIGIDTRVLEDVARVEMLPDGTAVRFSLRNREAQAFAEAAGSVTALRLVKR